MRYQIADGIIDYIHVFWVGFFLLPLGAISMGSASVFGLLREQLPPEAYAAAMVALAVTPYLAVRTRRVWLYCASRAGSALWFGYLGALCVRTRPYSTGMIYFAVACGALALLYTAVCRAERRREDARGERR
jgi:hypothetical protein